MSYAEILAFADATEEGLARARIARAIAGAEVARLQLDVVEPLFAFFGTTGSGGIAEYYQEERIRAHADAEKAVAAVRHALDPSGGILDDVTVHARDTFFSEVRAYAARTSRISDLVIAGQPERMDSTEAELLIGAVFGGGRPCLMLPRWIKPYTWGKRVFIAWKGTPEAARAVAGGLPFIRKAEAVRICCANPRGEREGEDEQSLNRLASYLMRRGANVDPIISPTSREGGDKLIAAEIERFNADLVVMGAYGHSRVRELIFGGLTEQMVRNANTAVLFAH
jgi:nucleotide-binding universal stress UspA family protein